VEADLKFGHYKVGALLGAAGVGKNRTLKVAWCGTGREEG